MCNGQLAIVWPTTGRKMAIFLEKSIFEAKNFQFFLDLAKCLWFNQIKISLIRKFSLWDVHFWRVLLVIRFSRIIFDFSKNGHQAENHSILLFLAVLGTWHYFFEYSVFIFVISAPKLPRMPNLGMFWCSSRKLEILPLFLFPFMTQNFEVFSKIIVLDWNSACGVILGQRLRKWRQIIRKNSVTCLKLSKTAKLSDFRPDGPFWKNHKYF